MGLDISKITNAELQMLAYENDSERTEDINILIGEEFTKFRKAALDWAKSKNTAEASEAVRQTLGLYVTQPAATTEKPEEVAKAEGVTTKVKTLTRKEIRQAKKEERKFNRNLDKLDDNKLVAGEVNLLVTSNKNLDNIVASLRENLDDSFKNYIDQVETIVNQVKNAKYDSKDDVIKLEKELKKGDLTEVQKLVLPNLITLAERNQIDKEYAKVAEIYNNAIEQEKDGNVNFTKRLEYVKKRMNKGSYEKEVLAKLESQMALEVKDGKFDKMLALDSTKNGYTKGRQIVKDLKKEAKANGDNFAKKVVKKDSQIADLAGIESRRMNRERTREDLKAISTAELLEKLDTDTFDLLRKKYLGTKYNEETKTYDLTELSDVIRAAVGSDEEMNTYEDYKKAEFQAAVNNLKEAIKRGDVTEKNLKALKELCNIQDAPKNRNAKDAFTRDWLKDSSEGAVIGAVLGLIDVEQIVDIKDDIVDVFARNAVNVPMGAAIPVAMAADYLLGGLTNIIFGMEDGERTCFDYEKAKNKTFAQYVDTVNREEQNETKKKAIIALAKLYVQKYGESGWNKEFLTDMKKVAGNEVLNCKEFLKGKLELTKKLEIETPKTEGDNKPKECKAEVQQENVITPDEEQPWHEHKTEYGQEWQFIIQARYPELTKKYGLWGNDGAIKRVQRAMYTDKNGNFDEAGFKQLIGFKNLREIMYLPLEVDGYKINTANTIETRKQVEGVGNKVTGKAPNGVTVKLGKTEKGDYIVTSTCDPTKIGRAKTLEDAFKKLEEATPGVVYTNKEELIKKYTKDAK